MVDDTPTLQQREESWPGGTLKARWTVQLLADGTEVRHGLFESFYENGIRSRRGFYDCGAPVEVWTTWDDSGRELFSGSYEAATVDEAPEPDAKDWDEPIIVAAPSRDSRLRGLWMLECVVVMALAWLMPMTLAVFSEGMMASPDVWTSGIEVDDTLFLWTQIPAFAGSLQILLPLLYIIWRSDASWRDVGIVRPNLMGLVMLGPILAAASLGADWILIKLLQAPDPPAYWAVPESGALWILFVVILLANSLAEEFVWRGFLLHRLRQLSGSPLFALLISSVLFASYHLYQGPVSAGLVFVSGVIWGVSVLVTKRIWPAVVAHTIHNIVVFSPLGEMLFAWRLRG